MATMSSCLSTITSQNIPTLLLSDRAFHKPTLQGAGGDLQNDDTGETVGEFASSLWHGVEGVVRILLCSCFGTGE